MNKCTISISYFGLSYPYFTPLILYLCCSLTIENRHSSSRLPFPIASFLRPRDLLAKPNYNSSYYPISPVINLMQLIKTLSCMAIEQSQFFLFFPFLFYFFRICSKLSLVIDSKEVTRGQEPGHQNQKRAPRQHRHLSASNHHRS